jgi:site-specific DNA recombinase
VAEYERTLIAERMRRGRLAKLRSGQLLPWLRVPFGYRTDPERPRNPAGLRVEEYEAAIVRQMFAWYLEQGATLGTIARRLTQGRVLTPTGKISCSRSTIRGILKNHAYIGNAYGHCTYLVQAKNRRSPLEPVGAGFTAKRRPGEEWIGVPVPEIVEKETFFLVQEKLSHNRKFASRNNKSHRYLLRALVSCGVCGLGANARTSWDGRSSYVRRGQRFCEPYGPGSLRGLVTPTRFWIILCGGFGSCVRSRAARRGWAFARVAGSYGHERGRMGAVEEKIHAR